VKKGEKGEERKKERSTSRMKRGTIFLKEERKATIVRQSLNRERSSINFRKEGRPSQKGKEKLLTKEKPTGRKILKRR